MYICVQYPYIRPSIYHVSVFLHTKSGSFSRRAGNAFVMLFAIFIIWAIFLHKEAYKVIVCNQALRLQKRQNTLQKHYTSNINKDEVESLNRAFLETESALRLLIEVSLLLLRSKALLDTTVLVVMRSLFRWHKLAAGGFMLYSCNYNLKYNQQAAAKSIQNQITSLVWCQRIYGPHYT